MNPATAPTIDLNYFRLKVAYLALKRFRAAMDKKYGRDRSSADREALSHEDLTEYVRLAKARTEATRLADEETIDRVIAEGAN